MGEWLDRGGRRGGWVGGWVGRTLCYEVFGFKFLGGDPVQVAGSQVVEEEVGDVGFCEEEGVMEEEEDTFCVE